MKRLMADHALVSVVSRDLVLWALRVDLGKVAEGSSAPHAGIGGAVDGGRTLVFCRQWTAFAEVHRCFCQLREL